MSLQFPVSGIRRRFSETIISILSNYVDNISISKILYMYIPYSNFTENILYS